MSKITSVFLRDVLDQYDREEISLSRFAEMLNERVSDKNVDITPTDILEINKMSYAFMNSGKTMGGGSEGWIRSAYVQGCIDMATKNQGVIF